MRRVNIKEPIWSTRSVGVAEYKVTDDILVEIEYKTKDGEKPYPLKYFMNKNKVLKYPSQIVKGTKLRIIPIRDFEVREE